jgi:hypothetical protein
MLPLSCSISIKALRRELEKVQIFVERFISLCGRPLCWPTSFAIFCKSIFVPFVLLPDVQLNKLSFWRKEDKGPAETFRFKNSTRTGLPDGLFSYQKSQIGYILVGLGNEKVGISYDQLKYFTTIWYILWPFGICSLCSFGNFFPFWYVWTKNDLATLHQNPRRQVDTVLGDAVNMRSVSN